MALSCTIVLKVLILKLFWSQWFRKVFEFYWTGFLNGLEVYNILQSLGFKIIPKSVIQEGLWILLDGIFKQPWAVQAS